MYLWVRSLVGSVEAVDVDGVFTLRAGVGLCTLVTGVPVCVVLSVSICVVDAKMSASCRSAVVCCGFSWIGAIENVRIAVMRSCAARRMVSPGSMAGIFVCFGKNVAEPDMRYPFVEGMKKR
jgi:hypothetical protein